MGNTSCTNNPHETSQQTGQQNATRQPPSHREEQPIQLTLQSAEDDAFVVEVDRTECVGVALRRHLSPPACNRVIRKKWNDHLPCIWKSSRSLERERDKALLRDASLQAAQSTMVDHVKILEAMLGDEQLDLEASWDKQGVEVSNASAVSVLWLC